MNVLALVFLAVTVPVLPAQKGRFRILDEGKQPGAAVTRSRSPERWLVRVVEGWQGRLPDARSLADLSIPGTHDSGARFGFFKTQGWMIEQQLDAGIRFLDIRCRSVKKRFRIHHGPFDQRQDFDDVITAVTGFLEANPREVVVMRWKTNEYEAAKGSDPAGDIASRYMRAHRRFFIRCDDRVPTLGQARGKIVVLRNGFAGEVAGESKEGQIGLGWGASVFDKQDFYKVFALSGSRTKGTQWATLTGKTDAVLRYLDRAPNSRKWVVNHLSGSTGMTPWDVARHVNPAAYRHIRPGRSATILGTLVMDYPGEWLIYRVIRSNFE